MSEAKKGSFMEKFQNVLENTLLPIGQKISAQRHLGAVRDGMTILIPLTIIGGFACLLAVPPVPSTVTEPSNILYAFLLAWKAWATANYSTLMIPYMLTIGSISLYVTAGIAYELAKSYGMDVINTICSALLVFLCVSNALDLSTGALNVSMFGASYMFGGIIIAIAVVEITRFFQKKNITIKLPDSVPPNVAAPFNALIPLIVEVVVFILINNALTAATGAGITGLIFTIFQPLLKATNSLPSMILLTVVSSLFWFFGIHGNNMISPITSPILTANLAANLEAYQAGQAIPYILAGNVMSLYGGWITYHAYVIIMLFFCKSEQLKTLPKISAVPSMFNINEPNIFGMPTVLNVFTFVPGMLCPIINLSVYYLLAQAGIMGKTFMSLPFSTPIMIQAFLSAMDWRNAVLILILLILNVFICFPFLKMYDKQLVEQEKGSAE